MGLSYMQIVIQQLLCVRPHTKLLHVLSHLILAQTPCGGHYYYAYFPSEETRTEVLSKSLAQVHNH